MSYNKASTKKTSRAKQEPDAETLAIGKAFQAFRAARDLSTRDLAKVLQITHSFVAMIETGRYEYPVAYYKMVRHMMTIEERSKVRELFIKKLTRDMEGP